MSDILEKKQRLEKLKREKEERELLRLQKQRDELANAGKSKQQPAIHNEFIKNILTSDTSKIDSLLGANQMMGSGSMQPQGQQLQMAPEMKLSSFVIEMEILPKPKIETYDRYIEALLIREDVGVGAGSKEESKTDHHADNLSMANDSLKKTTQTMCFGLVSSGAAAGPSAELSQEEGKQDHHHNRDDDQQNSDSDFKILSKEEAKAITRTKEFENFITKASKIVERALEGSVDVLGASQFFEEVNLNADGEDGQKQAEMNMQNKERLSPLFTFQANEPTLRTVNIRF